MKKVVWAALMYIWFGSALSAQKESLSLAGNEDPLITVKADAHLFFWNARPVYDSMPNIVKEHQQRLNRGLKTSGSLMFHLDEGISLGLTYMNLNANSATDEANWLVPVTDSSGNTVIDPNTGQPLLGPRQGQITEQILINFYGVRFEKEFEIDRSFAVGISVAPGFVDYEENADLIGYKTKLEGTSLGVDLGLIGKYKMDQNWAAFINLGLFNSVIENPLYTDRQRGVVRVNYGEPISLINVAVGAGISYTFNKKIRKKSKKESKPDVPESDQERFKL